MHPRHDITADHAIGLLNRHLDGDCWTFRRLDSRTCVWSGPNWLRLETCEYADMPHRIRLGNRYGSVSFCLRSTGIGHLHDVATMTGGCDANLRDTLHALQIACDSMASARLDRQLNRSAR